MLCYNNQLTSLDVSKNTALIELYCYNNQLTSLELSNCIELLNLICCNNKLTSLNVADCIELTLLNCHTNKFTTQAYEDLMCSLNYKEDGKDKNFVPLVNIDDANKSIFMATTAQNAIDKGWNIIYDSLDDEGNVMEITGTTGVYDCPLMVNTSNCIKLIVTKGTNIGFTIGASTTRPIRIVCGSIDTVMLLIGKKEEEIRILAENEIVNIYGYVRDIVINKTNNPTATVKILEAKDNISLRWVEIEDISSMTTLNVSGCSTLDDIVCKQTKNIASLNISGCPNLKNLICEGTKLTTLNLNGFKNLIHLSCDSNSNLTSLNIEGCTSLNYLSSVGTKFSTQGYDSLMCYLPQGGGYYYPLLHKDDENASAFMATNAGNAKAKNWKVNYGETDSEIETTGTYDCNGLSIEEGDAMGIALYPNPAKTMLNIENAIGNVQIFDITGRMLINVENKETNLLQINVSNLSKGMYFVKVGNYTTKFVKE